MNLKTQPKKMVRDSNYELMRIVSMFMIVVWHMLRHGQVDIHASGLLKNVVYFIEAILIVHVNSYVLVTGYYQCKSKFKLKKLISLNNQAWFYRVVILTILLIYDIVKIGEVELLQSLFPLDFSAYWFIKMYLILYCFSPFLNRLIEKISKKEFQVLLMTCFIIFSVLPTISMQIIYNNGGGYSLTNFVFLYLLGAYFRYYPIQKSRIFEVNTRRKNQLIFLLGFISCFFVNFLLSCFSEILFQGGNIPSFFGQTISLFFLSYDNPLAIVGSLMYFFWFGTFEIKSKFINRVSSLTLGVYLIHDNPYMRQWLYPFLGFAGEKVYTGILILGKVFLCALAVFIVCALLEWIRQLLFKGINHLKITKWFQRKWRSYVTSLGDFDLMKELEVNK